MIKIAKAVILLVLLTKSNPLISGNLLSELSASSNSTVSGSYGDINGNTLSFISRTKYIAEKENEISELTKRLALTESAKDDIIVLLALLRRNSAVITEIYMECSAIKEVIDVNIATWENPYFQSNKIKCESFDKLQGKITSLANEIETRKKDILEINKIVEKYEKKLSEVESKLKSVFENAKSGRIVTSGSIEYNSINVIDITSDNTATVTQGIGGIISQQANSINGIIKLNQGINIDQSNGNVLCISGSCVQNDDSSVNFTIRNSGDARNGGSIIQGVGGQVYQEN